jgi:DNA-binding CsgD family transcriptional regulator
LVKIQYICHCPINSQFMTKFAFGINFSFLFILLIYCNLSFAQIAGKGAPAITNYSLNNFEVGQPNWAILQDKRGIMYFANSLGLIEFDGKTWNTIFLDNNLTARSVAMDAAGKVYVGGYECFGYLKADSCGQIKIQSLIQLIPARYRRFGELWGISLVRNQIILQTTKYLFILNGTTCKTIESKNGFHRGICNDGKFYVRENGRGICILENNELKLMPQGELFANERIYSILDYTNNQKFFVSLTQGVFLFDGQKFMKWEKVNKQLPADAFISCAANVGKDHIVFGTTSKGILLFDKSGQLVQHISKKDGLCSNTIYDILYEPANGGLWLATNNGIDYVEISSSFSFFPTRDFINSSIEHISLFQNRLFINSSPVIYTSNWATGASSGFKPEFQEVSNLNQMVFNIKRVDNCLFFLHYGGAYYLDVNLQKHDLLKKNISVYDIVRIDSVNNYYVLSSYYGLDLMKKTGNGFQYINKIDGIDYPVISIVADTKGQCWITTNEYQVQRLQINTAKQVVSESVLFDSTAGVPAENKYMRIQKINGKIILTTTQGYFWLNPQNESFEPYASFNRIFPKNKIVEFFFEDFNGNYWYSYHSRKGFGKLEFLGGDSYRLVEKPFYKFWNSSSNIQAICPLNDKETMIGMNGGMMLYTPLTEEKFTHQFVTLVRRVGLIRNGKTIFGGNFPLNGSSFVNKQPKNDIPQINYSDNSLRFVSSAIWYENNDKTEFQYKLDGFDKEWTAWTTDNQKDYTNLSPGKYKFKVRARNVHKVTGTTAEYTFVILAPWYRTYWAYLLYLVVIVCILMFILEYYHNELKRKNARLEKLVEKRTAELTRKQDALLEASLKNKELEQLRLEEELRFKNEEVKLKSKELINFGMHIFQKKILIKSMKSKLTEFRDAAKADTKPLFQELIELLNVQLRKDKESKIFQMHVKNVNAQFFNKLKEINPNLTKNELMLAALLSLNLSSKEIAAIENRTVRAIEMARYRIRARLNLKPNENLIEFLTKILEEK